MTGDQVAQSLGKIPGGIDIAKSIWDHIEGDGDTEELVTALEGLILSHDPNFFDGESRIQGTSLERLSLVTDDGEEIYK